MLIFNAVNAYSKRDTNSKSAINNEIAKMAHRWKEQALRVPSRQSCSFITIFKRDCRR